MEKIDYQSVIYTGYTYSGGIIAGEILKEIDGFHFPAKMEFRLLKERYGLIDLYNAVLNSKDPQIADLAIKDFYWLAKNFATKDSFFSKSGFGLQRKTKGNFLKFTDEFIQELITHKYPIKWHFLDYKKNYFKYISTKIIQRIFKIENVGNEEAYLSTLEEDQFILLSQKYIFSIMQSLSPLSKNDFKNQIILFSKSINPFSIREIEIGLKLLNGKMIIIDRDPRDIFIELIRSGKNRYIDYSDEKTAAYSFLAYYKYLRRDKEYLRLNKNILILNFEELIKNYDENLSLIYEFLDINPICHTNKFDKFKPIESIKNIGIWKNNHDFSKSINIIAGELGY